MPEVVLKKPDDLASLYQDLKTFHAPRDEKILQLQHMYNLPIMQSETGRTIYVNNEPWTATRLTVALITQGRLVFRGTLDQDDGVTDVHAASQAVSRVEKFLKAHFHQADMDGFEIRRNTFRRELAYYMAVQGWTAGINIVKDDEKRGWPILTTTWNPLDTFPDLNGGTHLVHVQRMSRQAIESTFGPDRPNGKIKGYAWSPSSAIEPQTLFDVLEYFDGETSAICVNEAGMASWIKPQKDHGLLHNPAWCNPLDGVPFRHASHAMDGADVRILTSPDPSNNNWLRFVGQSPMIGYERAYRYLSELANQIADVVERWSNPIVLAKTQDGKYVELDLTKGNQNTVDLNTIVEIIKPPTFPMDDRAWMEFVGRDIEKASYPRSAYGAVSSDAAAYTLQLMRAASGYIIEPLVQQAEYIYERAAKSILLQLASGGANKKKDQYIKSFPVRSRNARGTNVVEFMRLDELPDNVHIAATIKGAGIPQDKFQALIAVTQAVNAMKQPLPTETLIDEYLEREDPPAEMAKIFWEGLINNPEVKNTASGLITLLDTADKLAERGSERGLMIADAFKAMAVVQVQQMMAAVQGQMGPSGVGQAAAGAGVMEAAQNMGIVPQGQIGPPGPMGPPGAEGIPPEILAQLAAEGGAPGGALGPLQGEAQMAGLGAPGAPPPQISGPPTGPDPMRGLLMNLATRTGGLPPPI